MLLCSGRSTQTQLIQQYCDAFDGHQDVQFYTVYLDFAHIDELVPSSNIKEGILLRTLKREAEPQTADIIC